MLDRVIRAAINGEEYPLLKRVEDIQSDVESSFYFSDGDLMYKGDEQRSRDILTEMSEAVDILLEYVKPMYKTYTRSGKESYKGYVRGLDYVLGNISRHIESACDPVAFAELKNKIKRAGNMRVA